MAVAFVGSRFAVAGQTAVVSPGRARCGTRQLWGAAGESVAYSTEAGPRAIILLPGGDAIEPVVAYSGAGELRGQSSPRRALAHLLAAHISGLRVGAMGQGEPGAGMRARPPGVASGGARQHPGGLWKQWQEVALPLASDPVRALASAATPALTVVSISPVAGDLHVPVGSPISVTFSNPMGEAATEAAFSITPSVKGTFSWSIDNRTLTFTPSAPLDLDCQYTVILSQAAKDTYGNALFSTCSWSFTSSSPITQTYPTGTGVEPDVIRVYFRNSMDKATTEGAFSISPKVPGVFSWLADTELVFHPVVALDPATEYAVTISTAAEDSYGRKLPSACSWSFTTEGKITTEMAAGLHLVGLPGQPDWSLSTLKQTFGTTAVVRGWSALSQSYITDIGVGGGFWVLLTKPTTVSFIGIPAPSTIPHTARPGWNLYAHPYLEPMDWSAVTIDGSVPAFGWKWDAANHSYVLLSSDPVMLGGTSVVEPWEGFWLLAKSNCTVSLASVGTPAAAKPAAGLSVDWAIGLKASAGAANSRGRVLGLMKTAKAFAADVELQVLNIAGRPVAKVDGGYCDAGTHTALWPGRNLSGSKVPAGTYLLKVTSSAEDGTASSRLVSMQIR